MMDYEADISLYNRARQIPVCRSNKNNKKSTDPASNLAKPILLSAPSGVRTLDTLIKSQVLYQLS